MNDWANRFLIFFYSVALLAVLVVPFGDNGKSPISMIAVVLK